MSFWRGVGGRGRRGWGGRGEEKSIIGLLSECFFFSFLFWWGVDVSVVSQGGEIGVGVGDVAGGSPRSGSSSSSLSIPLSDTYY